MLRVEGKLVNTVTGRAIQGGEISASHGGMTSVATSGKDGMFLLAIPASVADSAIYGLVVKPPADSTYQAQGLTCPVSTTRGSGCPLGLVNSRPYFPDVAEISYRSSKDVPIKSAELRFTRTGGASFYGKGVENGSFTTRTDGSGRVALFGLEIYSTAVAEIIGRITVKLPPPLDSGWVDSVHLASALTFREPRPLLIFRVGPSLDQTYQFRRGGLPAKDVVVRLTRLSGVATTFDTVTAASDSLGRVRLGLQALSRGSITARLSVFPPAPDTPFSIEGIVIETREHDSAPIYGTWDVRTGLPISRVSRFR